MRASQPAHDGTVMLELVDGFAWMPLKVPAKRVELLEALTASGAFDHQEVCTTVATEMCALDKCAAVDLVDKLTRRLRTYPAIISTTVASPRGQGGGSDPKKRWHQAVGFFLAARAFAPAGSFAPPTPPDGARPPLRRQLSNQMPIPEAVLSPVAECWVAKLAATDTSKRELLSFVRLLAGPDGTDFVRTLTSLLHFHAASHATADPLTLEAVHLAIETVLEHGRRQSAPASTCAREQRLIAVWYAPGTPQASVALERTGARSPAPKERLTREHAHTCTHAHTRTHAHICTRAHAHALAHRRESIL
jgi:hypothetical protein